MRLTNEQVDGLREIARMKGMDFAGTVRYALDLYLDNFLPQKPLEKKPRF